MKLSAEIKEGRFIYKYEVGSSRGESSTVLDAELLCSFTSLLKYCSQQTTRDSDKFMDTLIAKDWVNKNKDEALNFINRGGNET